jgi:hypothetical protein
VGGEQVKVAFASNLAEAEMIQGILLDQGIPSFQRRSRGWDVPDFLAAGPRDILVPQAAEEDALELLADARVDDAPPVPEPDGDGPRPAMLLAGILAAFAGAAAIVWLLYQLTS